MHRKQSTEHLAQMCIVNCISLFTCISTPSRHLVIICLSASVILRLILGVVET